jgi:hypothetical protein
VHHQVSEKTSELCEVGAMKLDDLVILTRVMTVIEVLP